MGTFLTITIVSLLMVSIMFKTTWILLGKLLYVSLHALKWLIIIGLLTSLANMPQTYEAFGFTPLSLLVGDHIYKTDKKTKSNEQTTRVQPKVKKQPVSRRRPTTGSTAL